MTKRTSNYQQHQDAVMRKAKELAMGRRCPACAAAPGESCRSPIGREFPVPHADRFSRQWFTEAEHSLAEEVAT